ncbi:hypothetical protein GGQ84_001512 [Desulfitispora alkaliphila]|uniref:S-layer homology domain-containing protein n=1 Tax=Desulfitispora alkaliphila TaxID=622674 RepID=UPI003D255DDE
MKRLTIILLTISGLLVFAPASWAIPGFSGGVKDQYQYEEVVFVTGEPIRFSGSVDVTERERQGEVTVTYNFRLEPQDRSIDGRLTRRVTYNIDSNKRDDKGQTITQTGLNDNYRETIDIEGDRYTLESYSFSKSDVIDNRATSDFSSGNISGRKVYHLNGNEGKVEINFSGGSVGYENFWGKTETMLIDFYYEGETVGVGDEGNGYSWQGNVRSQVSDSTTKTLRYWDNEASYSSFTGGHMRITNSEMVSQYQYTLPNFDEDGLTSGRSRGTIQLYKEMPQEIERLIVPKFRDVNGHWAEDHIKKLYSLDVFDESSDFFVPNAPMSRVDFTKGLMRACNIRVTEEEDPRARVRRNEPPEELLFEDISVEDENYKYIKMGVEQGIISGISKNEFGPNNPLTRAQAITLLIRSLGFEHNAPNPGYYTSFADDHAIPNWAKDSIYMAQEIGLVQGDSQNRVNPHDEMTRAEASALLVRFLEFLERDLQRDYRENILLFN